MRHITRFIAAVWTAGALFVAFTYREINGDRAMEIFGMFTIATIGLAAVEVLHGIKKRLPPAEQTAARPAPRTGPTLDKGNEQGMLYEAMPEEMIVMHLPSRNREIL